uniref:Uncharacterized protein n=1 Tax=Romanomermis culicivorax TaxID=13658 RepID=A0A915HUB2_ROMCU
VSDDSSSDISDLKWPLDDKLPIFGETTPKRSSDEIQSQKSASCSSSRYISSPTSYRSRSGSEIKLDYFETINRIILCEPCSLDHYRSRIEKLNLLKAADSSKDGNAIFRVILFLKKTLNQSIFLELLHESPTSVVNQYIAYLKHSENNDDLLPVLLACVRLLVWGLYYIGVCIT